MSRSLPPDEPPPGVWSAARPCPARLSPSCRESAVGQLRWVPRCFGALCVGVGDADDRYPHGLASLRTPCGGAVCGAAAHNRGMNLIAIVLGVLAIILVILTAILPVIGAIFSWLALAIGVIGLVFGLLSKNTSGRNISIVACVLAGFRLVLGGGVI